VRLIWNVLRVYSYLFEAALCGAGLLLGVFALASSNLHLDVPWLPGSGGHQLRWILGLSVLGLICVALAIFGVMRVLLFLYSGTIAYFLFRGLLLSTQVTFSSGADARLAFVFVLASILAFFGSFPLVPRRRR
jgi:hypothetical protein